MVHPLPPSAAHPAPVASTSRIPYGACAAALAAPSRTFFTSRPTPSPRAHSHSHPRRRAHLIHPLARQRLTNLSFALAGLLSVATVSLGMSGSLGGAGVRPGCPARKDAAVALQDEGVRRDRERVGAAPVWKGKGRFLDDPVVPAVQAGTPIAKVPVGRFERVPRAEQRQAETELPSCGDGRIAETVPARASESEGWRGWVGAGERVV
ncbi:hypothetical protein JCM3770_002192 [Rhodotorula araucariae]